MSNILILYSTTDGHTIKICRSLQQAIEQDGHVVVVSSIDTADQLNLSGFDKIVIGASIRYGRHGHEVLDFIRNYRPLLESRPAAFFSVNIVARKPEKSQPDTNPYMRKFLGQIDWRPQELAVFAGKLDYPTYRFIDRTMIRFIMLLTGGPTDPATVTEFTDWQKVQTFGHTISQM